VDDLADSEAPHRKKKWLVLVLAGVVLLGGAGVLAWQLRGKPAADPAAAAKADEVEPKGMVAPEPFLANLADRGVSRFAKVTIRLVVGSEEEAKALSEDVIKQARLRSALLELISEQLADRLVTAEGKSELKKAVTERSAKALGCKVHDVLFTDFVVQF
jgi:flagellar basal body-associated protein FliL